MYSTDYLSKFDEQMRELENQRQNKMIDQETMNQKISEYQEVTSPTILFYPRKKIMNPDLE